MFLPTWFLTIFFETSPNEHLILNFRTHVFDIIFEEEQNTKMTLESRKK